MESALASFGLQNPDDIKAMLLEFLAAKTPERAPQSAPVPGAHSPAGSSALAHWLLKPGQSFADRKFGAAANNWHLEQTLGSLSVYTSDDTDGCAVVTAGSKASAVLPAFPDGSAAGGYSGTDKPPDGVVTNFFVYVYARFDILPGNRQLMQAPWFVKFTLGFKKWDTYLKNRVKTLRAQLVKETQKGWCSKLPSIHKRVVQFRKRRSVWVVQ